MGYGQRGLSAGASAGRVRRETRTWAGLLALAAALAMAPRAQAQSDDALKRVNDLYADIKPNRRSDLVVLPALAKMTPPPEAVELVGRAILIPAKAASFAPAKAWAEAPPQKAVLESLAAVTKEDNFQSAMYFGQPYGVEGVPIELVKAELYSELGDPPTLANARFLYLRRLEWAASLAHVEATRLLAAGDADAAMKTMLNWLFFSRQIAERETLGEKRWGVKQVELALERLRDLAYTDFRAPTHGLDVVKIQEINKRLRDREGFLGLERLRLPRADRIAAEQLIGRVFVPKGNANPEAFGPMMAQVSTRDRPLRLFSESGRWTALAAQHAGWFETLDRLEKIANDWSRRWALEAFDPVLRTPTDFEKIDRVKYATIVAAMGDAKSLFDARQRLRAEAVGTRTALGMYGYFLKQKTFPPEGGLSAIRPEFVPLLENDPYNSGKRPLEFFVPIRDQVFGPRETPRPHTVRVFNDFGNVAVDISLGQDQFVLYSVGPDDSKGFAKEAAKDGGDYLIWPPMVSLYRQYLIDNGQMN
ncbi:MAG: hypothetical protein JNM07_00635 [Phycisphaerae bacterium]|nr:hypothetical protein [Phycisphaerae bacterium]